VQGEAVQALLARVEHAVAVTVVPDAAANLRGKDPISGTRPRRERIIEPEEFGHFSDSSACRVEITRL